MERKYEIGYILNPETTEEEVKKFNENYLEIIKKYDCQIDHVDEWGRKKFAYPIKHFEDGFYTFITIISDGQPLAELERRLKLSEKVLRFIVVRLDERLKKSNKLVKKWKKIEKFRKSQEPVKKEETERERERESSPREKEAKNAE
jgi:small subunit ribosomal protein S6